MQQQLEKKLLISKAKEDKTRELTNKSFVTIAEFLAAEVNDGILYELTGVVSNIANTTYGNFDLVDDTGSIYVYGLSEAPVAKHDMSFGNLGIEEGDIVDRERNNLILIMYKEGALILALGRGNHRIKTTAVFAPLATSEAFELLDGSPQLLGVDRLEDVVDAIDLECFKSILIVCRSEDYRYIYLYATEDTEGVAIGKVYIHKYNISGDIAPKKLNSLIHRLQYRHHLDITYYGSEHTSKIYHRSGLILNYNNSSYRHNYLCKGRRTKKRSASSITSISLLATICQRLRRFLRPIPVEGSVSSF